MRCRLLERGGDATPDLSAVTTVDLPSQTHPSSIGALGNLCQRILMLTSI
jgi:hypothetical protein